MFRTRRLWTQYSFENFFYCLRAELLMLGFNLRIILYRFVRLFIKLYPNSAKLGSPRICVKKRNIWERTRVIGNFLKSCRMTQVRGSADCDISCPNLGGWSALRWWRTEWKKGERIEKEEPRSRFLIHRLWTIWSPLCTRVDHMVSLFWIPRPTRVIVFHIYVYYLLWMR